MRTPKLALIRLLFLFFGVLSPAFPLFAQVYFNHFQVEQGLSNNAILCSAQDADGFMWFGTRDGLNRFDGYNFKHYHADPDNSSGLGSNFIHSLLVSQTKEIWIGTDQGLYIFDPYKEVFSTILETHQNEIVQIEQDSIGDIWFIATDQLYHYKTETKELYKKTSLNQLRVSHFCIDKENKIWYGSGTTLALMDSDLSYSLNMGANSSDRIERLCVDQQNNIWIGTSRNGLFKWSRQTEKITPVINNILPNTPVFVRDIVEVDAHHLWIATEIGVLIYDKRTDDYQLLRHEKDDPWSLSDNAVYTITQDHQQGIWVGTFFGGVNYYHAHHNFFEKIFPRYSTNSIQGHATREIVEDRYHHIWIGTEDQGLTWWNPSTNDFYTFSPATGLAHSNIHGLALTGDSLLVGTFYRGMNVIDIRTKKILKHYNMENTQGTLGDDFVFSIYRTRAGRILLATSRGLYEFFPGKDRFQIVEELPSYIFYTSIFEDNTGNIWLSTWRNGLFRFSPDTKHVQRYMHDRDDKHSINNNRVNRIFQDSKGEIWVATASGIALWNRDADNFHRITKADGLPSNLILSFEEDNNQNIWIGTTHGLVKMGLHNNDIEIFDTELGLLDLQFNYNSSYRDSKGILYFGSSKGLIRFDPSTMTDLHKHHVKSPIYITGIQTNQQELTIGDNQNKLKKSIIYTNKIELNHDESTISLDFAALNFISSKSTSYRYRLVGLDTTWTILRNNDKAKFTKIPPGKYTFEVLAVDANGKSISEEKRLQITIKPPLWASPTAIFTYWLLAISIICYAIYLYDNRVKEKNKRRLEIIKNHKDQEVYKAKMDFLARITHDIKTPLTLIKAPLEKLSQNNLLPPKREQLLRTIRNNTDTLIELTDKLLDFRKIESDHFTLQLKRQEVNKLVQLCISTYLPLLESKHIQLSYRSETSIEANIDGETIYKILDNLLSNAVKYSDKHIVVDLRYTDSSRTNFELRVGNDGKKLSEKDIKQIFKPFHRSSDHYQIEGSGLGLSLSFSYAKLHGGSLDFMENSENLNIFVLTIPI